MVHYPDPDCSELVELLAQRHGVARQQVIVGNGSTEILFVLARAVAFERAVIAVPAYIDYAVAVQTAGREVALLALQEDAGFALDWQTLEVSLRGGELVMLGQPNNPTGRAFEPDQFRALAARHPSTTFAIDEAFADFVDGYRSLAATPAAGSHTVRMPPACPGGSLRSPLHLPPVPTSSEPLTQDQTIISRTMLTAAARLCG